MPPGPGEVEIDTKYVGLSFKVRALYVKPCLDKKLTLS